MKLYAVRIFVKDFGLAKAFYGDTLGLTKKFEDDGFGWAEYDVGGPVLGIEKVADDDADGAKHLSRFLGISLQVDDIQQTYQDLKSKGVTFTGPPEKQPWGGTLAFLKDPEGNVITLLGE